MSNMEHISFVKNRSMPGGRNMRPTDFSAWGNAFCILPVSAIKAEQRQLGAQTSDIAAGILKHGLVKPIGVVVDGPNYHIVYGQQRFAAVKKLGWTEIPAQVLGDPRGPGSWRPENRLPHGSDAREQA
jgi:hypothetical protein